MDFTGELNVELVEFMGSDETVAQSARVSTGKEDDTARLKGLINYLVKNRHTSTLEHCVATFKIEAPIFVAREAMRHRTFSFNEISGRYAKLDPKFYVPQVTRPMVNEGSGAHPKLVHFEDVTAAVEVQVAHIKAFQTAYGAYEKMLDTGVATEVARNVLPVATYTRWYMTGNLNNWFKFLDLRTAENAQWEIREIAGQIEEELLRLYPVATEAWKRAKEG